MKYLVLDTETGGLIAQKHSILQVGMMAYDPYKGVTAHEEFFIRHRDYVVSPEALEVNGLNIIRVSRSGINPLEAMDRIVAFIHDNFPDGKDSFYLMGKQPSFDKAFLSTFFYKHGGDPIGNFISHRMVDLSSLIILMKELGLYPAEESTSLVSAARHYGLDVDHAHDVMGDCLMTIQLYEKIISLLKNGLPPSF
jgi:DNA polymerase III epsilon subunit-like protein